MANDNQKPGNVISLADFRNITANLSDEIVDKIAAEKDLSELFAIAEAGLRGARVNIDGRGMKVSPQARYQAIVNGMTISLLALQQALLPIEGQPAI